MTSIYDTPNSITDIVSSTGNIIVDPNIPDAVTPLDIDLLRFKPQLPPIDYTNLDFSSIKLQLLNLLKANSSKLGYSVRDFADSNTAGMMMNLMAYMGQMLSYHTDSMVNELFLDTSQSTYSTYRLLNMFKYKPSRPQQGVLLLKVTRNRSVANSSAVRDIEDASEIVFSSSLSRRELTFGSETFELFPAILTDGVFEPDYLGDFILPPYVTVDDPDAESIENELNTYTCFALSGTTLVEDFKSNGTPNQIITLSSGPVLNSSIIVQVQDTTINIPGKYAYNTWGELSYLALAGFKSATEVGATKNLNTPYLLSPFKLSEETFRLKQNNLLQVGMMLAINYDNEAIIAKYEDFVNLNVPYRIGIISNLTSSTVAGDNYVDLLLYHPAYVYGKVADNTDTAVSTTLDTEITNIYGDAIAWSAGDILYLLEYKDIGGSYKQPQLVSDTQIELADPIKYPSIKFLKSNPSYKIAIGKVLSDNVIAFGLSADIDTYYKAESVYEATWDGNFNIFIRFGDGHFGAIPTTGAAIKVIYRVNNTGSYGYIIKAGESEKSIRIGGVIVSLNNEYSSSPSSKGESIESSKELVTRFFAAQDRAVGSEDYITLAKKYNSNYKVAASLVKSDSDGSIIRLYCLSSINKTSVQPLTLTEKYQLRNYLNKYKCIGVDIEVADGLMRTLDIRLDVKVKAGYLSGQIRNDVSTSVTDYFKMDNFEMGMGLNSFDFIKSLSAISGIESFDIYVGGLASAFLPDGTILATGVKTYKQLKDIPGYKDSLTEFPKLSSEYDILFGAEYPIKPYEIIVLNTTNLQINIAK